MSFTTKAHTTSRVGFFSKAGCIWPSGQSEVEHGNQRDNDQGQEQQPFHDIRPPIEPSAGQTRIKISHVHRGAGTAQGRSQKLQPEQGHGGDAQNYQQTAGESLTHEFLVHIFQTFVSVISFVLPPLT